DDHWPCHRFRHIESLPSAIRQLLRAQPARLRRFLSRAIEVAANVARGVEKWEAAALRLGAARLAAAPFRSARLIVPLTDPAAHSAYPAQVLAPAVRRLHCALGHRSGGLDEPDIRTAGDTKDTAAAKASARDLQDGLAVDKKRAAALL